MGIRINTNIASINTQRHLLNATQAFAKSMEKLSSGLRITRAGDDAAGLAISESLKADIRALNQASRNASDGISMLQTAEGAMDEVSNILQRMKELAQQSLNGTLGDAEREYLNLEYTALIEEMDRIAATTDFNGVKMLDGTGGIVGIQVGITNLPDDRIAVDLSQAQTASDLGIANTIGTVAEAQNAMGEIDVAIQNVVRSRAGWGAVQNRLESTIRNISMTAENLSAANSRIRDVDVAYETSRMTSYQILQQAGISMLSQANLVPGLALSLLVS
jgi:flagellin